MCAAVVDSLRILLSRKYISKSSSRVVRKTTLCFVGWLMFFDSQNIFYVNIRIKNKLKWLYNLIFFIRKAILSLTFRLDIAQPVEFMT